MDVLDNYKKAWENQPDETNKVSKIDIYKMTKQNSSSIVKWIFIIGILEFAFWLVLSYFSSNSKYMDIYKQLGLHKLIEISSYVHYVVIVIFLFIFYKNYSTISVTDGTKQLINKILRVRKTVKFYVLYNLLTFFIMSIIINGIVFTDKAKFMLLFHIDDAVFDDTKFYTIMLVTQIVFVIIFLVLFWLFYQLLYGILLRKLNTNHKELSKLEELN